MNEQNFMMTKGAGLVNKNLEENLRRQQEMDRIKQADEQLSAMNNGMIMRRKDDAKPFLAANAGNSDTSEKALNIDDGPIEAAAEEKSLDTGDKPAAETVAGNNGRNENAKPAPPGGSSAKDSQEDATKAQAAKIAAIAQNAQNAAMDKMKADAGMNNTGQAPQAQPRNNNGNADQKPPQGQAEAKQGESQPGSAQTITKIRMSTSPDALTTAYADMFMKHFGLEISKSICFENMRKFCEPNIKEYDKTLYFMENTYRLSSLIYLMENMPITIAASILAEKNRANVMKYVVKEVELGGKPYDQLRKERLKRWAAKYSDMDPSDAITVTLGVTMPIRELLDAMTAKLDAVSSAMRKYNKSMTKSAANLDDSARNDVVYIYSNVWYFLQAFENDPDARRYFMAITDDTRKNLKI